MRDLLSSSTPPRATTRRRAVAGALLASLAVASLAVAYAAPGAAEPAQRFAAFSHATPQHARMPCLLCHRRETNAARPVLPGHSPCAGCHAQQFADPASPICAICHTNAASGALKAFPGLRSFNVRFDHAKHARGAARPRQACATCHKPERRGVALSIPAGTSAHATCFQCHTPRATAGGRDISSCGVCHQRGRYSRTPELAAAFRVNFSHASHRTAGLGCNDCHDVRPGRAQKRQVTSPVASQHRAPAGAVSCATCHDNRRAFGGDDFADCKRCHQGDTWHF
jgi:c(7)-type cytochrome triheme protein